MLRDAMREAKEADLKVQAYTCDKSFNSSNGSIVYMIIFKDNNDNIYVWKAWDELEFVKVYLSVEVGDQCELTFNGQEHVFSKITPKSNIKEINGMSCLQQ